MDHDERSKLVDAWTKLYGLEGESPWRDTYFWAYEKLDQLCHEEPVLAWELILDILSKGQSERILSNLAAGPLEDLLSSHGDRIIGRVEHEAARNELLRQVLGGVWQNEMSDELWKRVQAAAGRR